MRQREKWCVLKQSEHIKLGCIQGELIDAQVDEIVDFQKVLWKPEDSTGKAFQTLANWISCGVFCRS